MNLDEFIKESLLQILKGIREAQKETENQGNETGVINPKWGEEKDYYKYKSEVAFDIAISAVDKTGGGGKAGVRVLALEIGGGGEVSHESSRVSRVSFKLPVSFRVVPVIGAEASPRD